MWDNKGDIIIGNDVDWLQAVILSGVRIGDGAIIGSRAVVTKDVPPIRLWEVSRQDQSESVLMKRTIENCPVKVVGLVRKQNKG